MTVDGAGSLGDTDDETPPPHAASTRDERTNAAILRLALARDLVAGFMSMPRHGSLGERFCLPPG
jgi:hypothetical protein